MTLAQLERKERVRTGRCLDSLHELCGRASGPGIPFADLESAVTTYGSARSDVATPWEQLSFVEASNKWVSAFLTALPFAQTGSTADIIEGVVVESKPRPWERLWELTLHDNAQLIARIRSSLSLQMKELAEVLGVERPTVYAWIKERSAPQKANRERLHWLYRVAGSWDRLSHRPPGDHVRDSGSDGRSLLDVLREPEPNETEIDGRLRALAQTIAREQFPPRVSVESMAAKHGISLEHIKDQQDELDVLTGKRFDED